MKKVFRRLMALLCILTLSFGMLHAIALSGNTTGIDVDKSGPEHDISVMSFNILDYVDGNVYASPKDRAPMAVKTIVACMPDIVGIQEAGDPQSSNGSFDWNDYLVGALAPYGYACRYLTQEPVHPSSMTIGAGLMIFYKASRFNLVDHGSAQYATDGKNGTYAAYQGFTRTDTSRYYHYVKLYDKQYKTHLYTFNTHLSVPAGSVKHPSNGTYATSEQRNMLCYISRTKQAAMLAAAMKDMAGDLPCFATGDYNSSWSNSVADDPNKAQLTEMTKSGYFLAAGDNEICRISYSPNTIIDHVFYNRYFSKALSYRGIYEEYGGYQPSDHKAMLGHFNYCTPITFASGEYDEIKRTFVDTVDKDTYNFSISDLPTSVTYSVQDQNGNTLTEGVPLPAHKNHCTLQFYNNGETLYQIKATLYNSTATLPELGCKEALNCYFNDGAYYLAVDSQTTQLSFTLSEGALYSDAACTKAVGAVLNALPIGKSTLYLKTDTVIVPVHLMKASATAKENTLYVDSRLNGASGKAVFVNAEGGVQVEMGVNGFATIAAAASIANKANGYTIKLAPGFYKEGAVTFTKNVSILGNNDGVSPLVRSDQKWSLATNRNEETVIDGGLYFKQPKNSTLAVRGITFNSHGRVEYAIALTAYNDTSLSTMDIAQNIFEFCGTNMTNSSCIYLNSAHRKVGNIHDNFFRGCGVKTKAMGRYLTLRNPYGLVFEENYVRDFPNNAAFMSSEISNGNLTPGHFDFTVRYNRLENCASLTFYIQHTDKNSTVNAQVLYNDIVECGNFEGNPAFRVYLSDDNSIVTDYTDYTVNLFGNRFFGCQKALYYRVGSNEGDVRDAKLNINQNRIIGMHQSADKKSFYFQFDMFDDSDIEATSENWDFSHNYFDSDTVKNSHHPDDYVYTSYTYNNKTYDCIDRSLFYPYYTDAVMHSLSGGNLLQEQTGITVSDTLHQADGLPHSLQVNAPADAVVSYSLDGSLDEEARAWQSQSPACILPGNTTVYYMVERMGYYNYYGSAVLEITPAERTLEFKNATVSYDGTPKSLTFLPLEGDTVKYTYDGNEYSYMPTFTEIGNYTVTVTVSNPLYGVLTATAKLTINRGTLNQVALSGVTTVYDGKAHAPTLTLQLGTEMVTYSVNGGEYSSELPTFTEPGEYEVMAKFVADKYLTAYRVAIITILPREERAITISGFGGAYDGQPHSITVTGTTEKDTLYYRTENSSFDTELPTFTERGSYTVFIKVCREGYEDLLASAVVYIGDEPQLFTPVITICTDVTFEHKVSFSIQAVNTALYDSEDILFTEYGLQGKTKTVLHSAATGITGCPTPIEAVAPTENIGLYLCYRVNGVSYEQATPTYIAK